MKKFLIICMAAACLFAFSACGGSDEEKNASAIVGISLHSDEDTSWYRGGEDLKNGLTELGYEVILENTEDDVTRQIAQIEDMIRVGASVIIVSPTEPSALDSILSDARAAGIKIISFDKLITDTENVDYYLTFGFEEAGRLQAEYLTSELGLAEGRTASIEVFCGNPDELATGSFYNGVMDNLYGYINSGALTIPSGRIDIESVSLGDDDAALAKERMSTFIGLGIKPDAVVCQTDGIARGVIEAYDAAGVPSYEFPIITGQNAEASAVSYIAGGKQRMTVFKDIRTLSSETIKAVDTILKGGEPVFKLTVNNGSVEVPTWTCESSVIENYNYKSKLIDSGYYTAEEVGGLPE